jgi:hypothetical protein
MGFLDGFNPDDFNFGNYGNDNPFDTDPFPMEQFRTAQLPQMLNQGPAQQNTISGVMNEIGSGVQQNPTLSRYLDLAAQGPPKREDYEAGTGRKILAAVGGLGYLFSDPRNATKNVEGILDHPYDEAAAQYKDQLGVAADAAKQEGSLLNTGTNIFGHISQEENYRNLAQNREGNLDYKYASMQSRQGIADQKIQFLQEKMGLDNALRSKQIDVNTYNARTARIDAELKQLESPSLIDARQAHTNYDIARTNTLDSGGPLSGSRSTGPTVNRPNAAVMNRQVESAVKSSAILMDPEKRFFLPDGSLNIPKVIADPDANIEYQRIMRNYGMVQQPPEFDMNNLFNVPGVK